MIKELTPAIIRKIWGGKKLEIIKEMPAASIGFTEPIGETLEIFDKDLPYLAKFIDTSEALSIQVHPDNEYARLHENSSGKTECWIILEANSGAGIYLGLKPHVSLESLKTALENKKAINKFLNFYPVNKGDYFYVPAGTIHAIGEGITLAEVQQNSGITYRVWDWDRLGDKGEKRELHIDKSLAVINFDPKCNTLEFFKMKYGIFQFEGLRELCNHKDFHLYILNLKKGETYQREIISLSRPCSILNLEGEISVNQTTVKSFCAVTIMHESQISISALENGSLLIIF